MKRLDEGYLHFILDGREGLIYERSDGGWRIRYDGMWFASEELLTRSTVLKEFVRLWRTKK